MVFKRQRPRTVWVGNWMLASLALAATACGVAPAPSQEPPATAAEPAAAAAAGLGMSYNELMVRWVDNASHVLWDAEKKGFAPKDEADWVEVEDHALQLAAAGASLQLPGTGVSDGLWVRQAGWTTNARLLSDAGRAAFAAAQSRNLPALVAANGTLVQSCENCHKEFKPDAPTEGVGHQRPHSESHAGN